MSKDNKMSNDNKMIEVINNDMRLFAIASYKESKGFMVKINNDDLFKTYSEFKLLVKRGSFTISQLEYNILNKYGITNDEHIDLNVDITFADMSYDDTRNT